MKPSPIQLLDSRVLRVNISNNEKYDSANTPDEIITSELINFEFQTAKLFDSASDFWDDKIPQKDGIQNRTFAVTFALKNTIEENSNSHKYIFEIIVGVVVAVIEEREEEYVRNMAFQYGLQIAFSITREVLMSNTSRMQLGEFLLPTVSFMDEKAPAISENDLSDSSDS